MKKILSLVCALAFVVVGLLGCSTGDDDNNVSKNEYAVYYGNYTGTMKVTMGSNTITQDVNYNVAENVLTDNAGKYGAYNKVLWFKNAEGKAVVAGQSDSTFEKKGALTVENATTSSSCYIVFNGDGTATYTVPAMAAMGGVAVITKQ